MEPFLLFDIFLIFLTCSICTSPVTMYPTGALMFHWHSVFRGRGGSKAGPGKVRRVGAGSELELDRRAPRRISPPQSWEVEWVKIENVPSKKNMKISPTILGLNSTVMLNPGLPSLSPLPTAKVIVTSFPGVTMTSDWSLRSHESWSDLWPSVKVRESPDEQDI